MTGLQEDTANPFECTMGMWPSDTLLQFGSFRQHYLLSIWKEHAYHVIRFKFPQAHDFFLCYVFTSIWLPICYSNHLELRFHWFRNISALWEDYLSLTLAYNKFKQIFIRQLIFNLTLTFFSMYHDFAKNHMNKRNKKLFRGIFSCQWYEQVLLKLKFVSFSMKVIQMKYI